MMKKILARVAPLGLALSASFVAAATVTVLVQQTTLRKKPQFYAPAAGVAKLGETFDAEEAASGWYKTDSGYIHQSAVTAKKVKVSASSSAGSGATADEVTLAGKGFNSQVEQSYGGKHPEADFAGVDAMEKRQASDEAVLEFMRSGGLLPSGGDR
ncbi:MAG: hypothetical protein HY079_10815 [Elusimicrobia bacterium]|nr:hypothetical protein [Elusimicrobiota bacterium]